MEDRREFVGHLVGGAALVAVGASAASMMGCNILTELETWVPIGLTAFDTIVSYINPVAGSAIAIVVSTVNNLWQAVATAIANYQHTTDPTTTLLDKVIAAMDALQSGLGTVLSSLPVGLSAAVMKAVTFGVNLLIATLKSIRNSIEPAAAKAFTALKSVTVNNVSSATSAKDFIKLFNLNVCVAAGYPARMK
jgi:hypothetical protein